MFRLWKLAIDGDVPRKYSLARISQDLLGIELDKNEEIRCNFADFMEVPTEKIPKAEFLEYGAKDVIATFHCFTRLRMEITRLNNTNNLSHHIQILGGLALNRMYKNGIGFDEDRATELLRQLNATLEVQHVTMSAYGFVKGIKGNQQAYNNVINYLG